MPQTNLRTPAGSRESSLLRAILLNLLLMGLVAVPVALFPYYSSVGLFTGISLTTTGTLAMIWLLISGDRKAQITWYLSLLSLILAIAARAWAALVPNTLVWFVPTLGAYILAWTWPLLSASAARLPWGVRLPPVTQARNSCVGLILATAPVAAILGASAGMYGARFWGDGPPLFLIGSLVTLVALGWAQAVASQFWNRNGQGS